MSRKSEFSQSNPNPAKKFLDWKSENKQFTYYDKDLRENVAVPLPFKFLTLMELHNVKGWHDASNSGITSNEVKFIGKEELIVRSFKGGQIAKGLYKDIKSTVDNQGGHYSKSIYIMLEDGSIANIQLKGSGVKEWGEFTQKSRSRLADEWVEVIGAEEKKKGRVNYSVPVFKYNTSLNQHQCDIADKCYDTLKDYMESYNAKKEEPSPRELEAKELPTYNAQVDDF